ncbi:MAG TPA: hypothetical protein ENN07_04690 [candidate division Zixibacteria bacterium]|nr:hypothetical protein [candidate division Zixibacteria bacterium]
MNWENYVLFDVNDLYDFEAETLETLDKIDRRTAVKGIIASRIRKSRPDFEGDDLLSRIRNPEILREPAIFLNLHLVFNANATGGGIYATKAVQYLERFESAIRSAVKLLDFEGLDTGGVLLIR